ncbi:unnamed protein product [Spirodela intermedia]|uniref:Uncharacterized protein n=2 Tax=Spirodela intermedia TaxID=51605 RepID=A0A7I8L0W6_SPIIN|nr:unnamed protein product [Spirodela intermedia]CAA6666434.1 unnamed protein product [Spirodela intermedia]CAA7403226.1 unnamed protein product [Spirodela intermedia]
MPGAVRRRPTVVVGTLVLVMLAGVSMVYLRLWIIDYGFSSQDRELLRKQFDQANMEAMDESAHWRMKYDTEVERSRQSTAELLQNATSHLSSEDGGKRRDNEGDGNPLSKSYAPSVNFQSSKAVQDRCTSNALSGQNIGSVASSTFYLTNAAWPSFD